MHPLSPQNIVFSPIFQLMWYYHHLSQKIKHNTLPHLPATFSWTEILPKSQQYDSSMFLSSITKTSSYPPKLHTLHPWYQPVARSVLQIQAILVFEWVGSMTDSHLSSWKWCMCPPNQVSEPLPLSFTPSYSGEKNQRSSGLWSQKKERIRATALPSGGKPSN